MKEGSPMKIGDKVKIIKDIPSIDGMLYADTVVKINQITGGIHGPIRVVDDLGKIWWVTDLDFKTLKG